MSNSSRSVIALFVACICLVPALRADDTSSVAEKVLEEADRLIEGMGGKTFKEREAAQESFLELGQSHGMLVRAKCREVLTTSDDPEVRERVREVAKKLVSIQLFGTNRGFLGVSLGMSGTPVKVEGVSFRAVPVLQVIPDTAAAANDIRDGDLIIGADDKVCNAAFNTQKLIAYISNRKPGYAMKFTIVRNGEKLLKEIKLGRRPNTSANKPLEQEQRKFFENWLRQGQL